MGQTFSFHYLFLTLFHFVQRKNSPLIPIWNSFPVCTEKFCFFDKKFYICLRFLKACADGCTVSMGIPPSRLSRRTLDLIEKRFASKRSFSAETVRSCVADLVRAKSPPCDQRLVSHNCNSKNLRFTQTDFRCIIVPCMGRRRIGCNSDLHSRDSRYTLYKETETPFRHCLGVPLCGLGIQGMYAGF